MRENTREIFYDTMNILEAGYYTRSGKKIPLKLSREEMEEILVYLPEDIAALEGKEKVIREPQSDPMETSCVNMDSYTLARQIVREEMKSNKMAGQNIWDGMESNKMAGQNIWDGMDAKTLTDQIVRKEIGTNTKTANSTATSSVLKEDGNALKRPSVLVLNLANPVNPGGGVRRGAKAQEEDLCRKSSLLLSLESEMARTYYDYNKSLHTYMGSDAVMITPQVEIIKDENGELLEDSVIVSVMTCAAPMLVFGMEGMTNRQYQHMVYKRITGMLKVAASLGYQNLVLGAFGCGAFANDAHVVSDLFLMAMQSFRFQNDTLKDCFRRIDFAVMDHSLHKYNYQEFARNFNRQEAESQNDH